MKKIIALCAAILSIAVIITAFTACDSKPGNGEETVSDNKTFIKDEAVFSAVVGESSVVIMRGDEVYQTLKFPVNSGYSVDVKYAQEHYEFIDMNFDGLRDFYVALGDNSGVINYFCWLFNDTTKEYDYSVTLSGLRNISVDSYNHRIISTEVKNGITVWSTYKWVNGVLTFDSKHTSEDESIPEEITNAAQNNAIGVDTTVTVTANANASDSKEDKTTEKNNSKLPVNTTDKNSDKTTDKTSDNTTEITTDKNHGLNDTTTDKADVPDSTTEPSGTQTSVPDTSRQDRPLNTTTTAPATRQDVVIVTDVGAVTEGWF